MFRLQLLIAIFVSMELVLKKIKEIRIGQGLTQDQMARELNLSIVSYGKIERGITELSIKRLYQISDILETSVFTILGQSDLLDSQEVKDKMNLDIQNLNEEIETYKKEIENLDFRLKDKEKIIQLYDGFLKEGIDGVKKLFGKKKD